LRSSFKYLRPASVAEAIKMKDQYGTQAIYWAGGTDLVLQWDRSLIKPGYCIDITKLAGMSFIENESSPIRIGALTALSVLERSDSNDPCLKAIAKVASMMCTVQTRTIATIAGNLCNASPAADLSTSLVAMGAILKVQGLKGERKIPLDEFMISPGKTVLVNSELVTEILIPKADSPFSSVYHRIDRTVVDIALVSAASSLTLNKNGVVASARVALGAVAPRVIRSSRAEALLVGRNISECDEAFLREVGEAASLDATPISDIRASAAYRTAMVKVLVRKTLNENCQNLTSYSDD